MKKIFNSYRLQYGSLRGILMGLCGFLLMSSPVYAGSSLVGTTAMNFMNLTHSVKTDSLGGAYTAGRDSHGLHLNPASIATQKHLHVTIQNLFYIEDMGLTSVYGALNTPLGVVGFDVGYMNYGSQVRTTWLDREGQTSGVFQNYAYKLGALYAIQWDRVKGGVALNYLREVLDSTTATGLGMDIGVAMSLMPSLDLAVAVTGLTLKPVTFTEMTGDLSTSYRLGLSYEETVFDQTLGITSDLVLPTDAEAYIGFGLEQSLSQWLNLRMGYSTFASLGTVSFGVGLALDTYQIDFLYKPVLYWGSQYRLGVGVTL